MNKKVFLFSTLAFVASIGATIAINNGNIMFPINANDQCEHEGFHYHQVDPTIEKVGHREYWVCCKCHESFLEAPIQGKFTDQDDASMINYEITNPAHLPVLNDTNYDLVEQSHVRDGVYKWENLTFTTKGQENKLIFNSIINKEDDNFGYNGNFNDTIKLGTQSFSLKYWNETYAEQKATVSWTNDATDRTLKIALKGTQDVIASTDGTLNLCTNYKQTIIDGSGTLNVKVTQNSSALDASNLTVAKGVTLNLIHNGNRGENGLLASGNIVFDGDVTFDNFQTAIYGKGNSIITINKDSK